MIQLVLNTYMILAIKDQPKAVQFVVEPSHPGCSQIVDPERYCFSVDDPFCKTIGDLCDADGFVKPEDAYCK